MQTVRFADRLIGRVLIDSLIHCSALVCAAVTYSLLMLPYLILAVPLFFAVLTDAEPTGYAHHHVHPHVHADYVA